MAYNVGRSIQRVEAFLPPEPGLRAHLFRVCTLSVRAAELQGRDDSQIDAIAWSALLHHFATQLDSEGASRLAQDLGLPPVPELDPAPEAGNLEAANVDFLAVIKALSKQDAALVESANLFDEQIENMPYEAGSTEDTLKDLFASGLISKSFASALESFQTVTRAELTEAIAKLPVFPKAAMEALRIARDPESGIREMEQAVSRDPVLAGETIQMANSGIFGKAHAVGTLSLALARVGTIAASHLISAAALQRCFASASLNQLWKHSFDTSANTVIVASEAKAVDGSDAFLAGLVHDVGRLAYELTPAGAAIPTGRTPASPSPMPNSWSPGQIMLKSGRKLWLTGVSPIASSKPCDFITVLKSPNRPLPPPFMRLKTRMNLYLPWRAITPR